MRVEVWVTMAMALWMDTRDHLGTTSTFKTQEAYSWRRGVAGWSAEAG